MLQNTSNGVYVLIRRHKANISILKFVNAYIAKKNIDYFRTLYDIHLN